MASQNAGVQKREQQRPQPAAKFRMGRITATVWENRGEKGPWYSTTILRSYKDGDEWKTTSSFGRDDLPLVEKVAALAHGWIFDRQQGGSAAHGGEGVQEGDEEIPF